VVSSKANFGFSGEQIARKTVTLKLCYFYLLCPQQTTAHRSGLTEIAGLDNDGRMWAIDCNQLKITIERFYQLTGMYNSFESVLCLKTYEIHIDKQKL